MKPESTIAIVPGSFDPITLGHIELVRMARARYDKVYVAVMINATKQYCFTLEQRTQIAQAALQDIDGVEVISSEGMLWQLAAELGACAIVKGYRNETDLAYEQKMAGFNTAHNPTSPTVLLPSPVELIHISSTAVRERIYNGEALEDYLPTAAIAVIRDILSHRGSK